MIYDRYTGQYMIANALPKSIDLGRYVAYENPGEWWDITNSDTEKFSSTDVNQPLLEDKHQNIHDLLASISESFTHDIKSTFPIIQEYESGLTPFEELLIKDLDKIIAIGANPHSLLKRITERVNIGRAKRLSTRSYQHLTHHSEDWERMSVINPKPRKILNEELEVDYAVYENVLFKVFLQRTIRYLNARMKQTKDIAGFFLDIFGKEAAFHKASPLRKDRYRALIGRALDVDESSTSKSTYAELMSIRTELVKLLHSPFLDEISNRALDTFVYHDTNVLNNHKYYKHLKDLWMELLKVHKDSDSVHQKKQNADIIHNLRLYVKALFTYTLLKVMDYEMEKSESEIEFLHHSQPKVVIKDDEWEVLHIFVGNIEKRIVTVGGYTPEVNHMVFDCIIFSFYDYQKPVSEKIKNVYFVNPIEAGSIEYAGIVIRQMIMEYYKQIIHSSYSFEHILTSFIHYFPCRYLDFNLKSFDYRFIDFNHKNISSENIIKNIQRDIIYKKKNHNEQKQINDSIIRLIEDINTNKFVIHDAIICPICGNKMTIENNSFLICNSCGVRLDYKNEFDKLCRNDDNYLDPTSFPDKSRGMDFVINQNI